MRIPGHKRSQEPDDVGNRAGLFAEALRDGHMDQAWSLLSRETRGMRMGVWATKNNISLQDAYQAGYDPSHALRASMWITMNGLRRRGHELNILEPYDGVTGREMVIQIDADSGVLQGAADPRYDGYAIGW